MVDFTYNVCDRDFYSKRGCVNHIKTDTMQKISKLNSISLS